MNPAPSVVANPLNVNPSPLMCEWDAIRGDLPADGVDGGRRESWGTCADLDDVELMMVHKSPR